MTLEIAQRLVQLRKAHGFSQEELAQRIGVTRQAVSKWERAESSPDTDNLIALAALYGVSLDALIRGEDEPAQPASDAIEPGSADDPLPNGSYFEHKQAQQDAANDRRRAAFPYAAVVGVAYVVLGACFNLWHPGWLIFLTIPLYYLPAAQRSPLRLLGNPVMVTIIYLLLGFECGLWHPGWVVFLLIPLLQNMKWK